MEDRHVSSLPVKKRHPSDAWGKIVVKDLIREVLIPGRLPKKVNAYEIMTKPVIIVPADIYIEYAAFLLHHAGIRRLRMTIKGNLSP